MYEKIVVSSLVSFASLFDFFSVELRKGKKGRVSSYLKEPDAGVREMNDDLLLPIIPSYEGSE
jgi:hypothetical protein